jgi:phage FluMu gp28-like protein
MASAVSSPVIPLTAYQKRWVEDRSRFKIGKWSRQAGKSFGTSLEAVLDCLDHKTQWVFLSAGERQSKELMSTASMHARALDAAIEEVEGVFVVEDGTTYKQLEIIFPNGSRIVGLPANPNTARGLSANVLLDEFAFHKDSRGIWRALFPTVTRGYMIRIISTPQGKKNKFYELWTANTLQLFDGLEHEYKGERGGWSKHNVTIFDAVAMGLVLRDEEGMPCEPEDLRLSLNDDEAWHQEYLVEFLDETTAWLTYDLIESVEDERILAEPSWVSSLIDKAKAHHEEHKRMASPPAFDASEVLREVPFSGEIYLGMDIGRRRDLSVIWLDEIREGVAWTRAAVRLVKQPFGVQKAVLHALLGLPGMRRGCIDASGLGMQLAEQALERFGEHRVEAVDFTAANKEALATGIKKSFEDLRDRIPADHTIRQSLHSVKRIETATGHFRFDADRTEQTGHADDFWAKALAVLARSSPSWEAGYEQVGSREAVFRGKGAW